MANGSVSFSGKSPNYPTFVFLLRFVECPLKVAVKERVKNVLLIRISELINNLEVPVVDGLPKDVADSLSLYCTKPT